MRALITAAAAHATLGVLAACAAPPARPATYPVAFLARAEDGAPLPGLRLAAAGRALGVTDAEGRLSAELSGREGQTVGLDAVCPEGFEGPLQKPALRLRTFESLEPGGRGRLRLELTCRARERLLVVAVSAGTKDLPILLRGEPLARTGAAGTAHVLLRVPDEGAVRLTLDTTAHPELRPQSPSRTFAAKRQDEFAVWVQTFEQAPKTPRKRSPRSAQPAPPKRYVPYRLE